jgi:hypothetical protein
MSAGSNLRVAGMVARGGASACRHGRRCRQGRRGPIPPTLLADPGTRVIAIIGHRLDPSARAFATSGQPSAHRPRPASRPPDSQHNSSTRRRTEPVHASHSFRATSPEGNTNARQYDGGAQQLNVTVVRGPRQSARGDALEPQTDYLIQIAAKCVQPGCSRSGTRERWPGQTGYCHQQRSLQIFTRVFGPVSCDNAPHELHGRL